MDLNRVGCESDKSGACSLCFLNSMRIEEVTDYTETQRERESMKGVALTKMVNSLPQSSRTESVMVPSEHTWVRELSLPVFNLTSVSTKMPFFILKKLARCLFFKADN